MRKIVLHFFLTLVVFSSKMQAQCGVYQVPFYEGFQGITVNNQLPGCWAASNMSATCLTFAGTKNAGFYYLPALQNYFYSPAIHLKAGVVYSVSTWYKADFASSYGWNNLSIMVGPSQSTTGLTNIITVASPWVTSFTALSGTLAVSSTGTYFFAVTCASNGSGSSQYLQFDDLVVAQPCSLNAPSVSITATPPTVCEGDTITFVASGADSYTWCGGATGDTLQVIASNTASWLCNNNLVTGEDTASGCSQGASPQFTMYPTPVVNAIANPNVICKGEVSNLMAFGTTDYYWTFGALTAGTTVTPAATTGYTVLGSNIYGCYSTATVQVVVNPLPPVEIPNFPGLFCANTVLEYTSTYLATSYTWNVGSQTVNGNPLLYLTPMMNGTVSISLSLTDNNGCVGTATNVLWIQVCGGLEENARNISAVYPNPSSGSVVVISNVELSSLKLFSVGGIEQLINWTYTEKGKATLDISHLPDGIYWLRVGSEVRRLIKQSL